MYINQLMLVNFTADENLQWLNVMEITKFVSFVLFPEYKYMEL